MKSHSILLLVFAILLCSCQRQENPIVQTDFQSLINTIQESDQGDLGNLLQSENRFNTIGKTIPSIRIYDNKGKEKDLRRILKKPTLLIASSPYGEYGFNEMLTYFPATVAAYEGDMDRFDIICLLVIDKEMTKEQEMLVKDALSKLGQNYQQVYTIDSEEAAKINILSDPTKFFINKDGVVVDYSMGVVMDDYFRQQELLNGIELMFKKRL